jgi:hypothetical protein
MVQKLPEWTEEGRRRAELLLQSGPFPEWLFVCATEEGTLTLNQTPGQPSLVLIFSTPFFAQDYLRATKVDARVRQFQRSSLPEMARKWIVGGSTKFVLDRCPRCRVMNALSLDAVQNDKTFLQVWATFRAAKMVQGGRKFREAMPLIGTARARARALFEEIRDHIDCGCPYVHEMIASLALMDGEEAARNEAVERLKEFGPQFADWEVRWAPDNFVLALSTAVFGIAAHFGVDLKLKQS